MSLLSGDDLKVSDLFCEDKLPRKQASSVELTIGSIYDVGGKSIQEFCILKPGEMIQVSSAECFTLPEDITAHITYKTTLTRKGIWALTVGIVDPGWNGPISTTLLNFSRQDYVVSIGDPFLRASFFKHNQVERKYVKVAPDTAEYIKEVRNAASTIFPKTFLDSEKISRDAGDDVLEKIRNQAIAWVAGVALIFTVAQLIVSYYSSQNINSTTSMEYIEMKNQINELNKKIEEMKKNDFIYYYD